MRLSVVLFHDVQDLWDQAAEKPFVVEMAKGTLDERRYRAYMIQDYLYLLDYVDMLGCMRGLADDSALKDFIDFVIEQTRGETQRVHVPHMRRLGITDDDVALCPKAPEIVAYVEYMLGRLREDGVLAGLTAQLQCSWVYAYVAQRATEAHGGEIPASPYKDWFDAYTSAEYLAANQQWIDILDERATSVQGEEARRLSGIFRTCAEYENKLWDALYRPCAATTGPGAARYDA